MNGENWGRGAERFLNNSRWWVHAMKRSLFDQKGRGEKRKTEGRRHYEGTRSREKGRNEE